MQVLVLVCETIHTLFIETPLLIKLVHFQGYQPELVPTVVHGVT